jgi:hypothetical protein
VLDQYVGHYTLDVGLSADIRRQGAKLIAEVPGAEAQELHALGTNRFYLDQAGGVVEFLVQTEGPVRLKFTHEGSTIGGERTAAIPQTPAGLEEYQGTYWSDEVETEYTIMLKDGKLTADHLHHGEIALYPVSKDRFSTREWFMPEVRFLRDSSNSISGVTLGGGRVTGILFNRKGS